VCSKGKALSKKTLYLFKMRQGQGQALQRFSEILCFFCGKTALIEGRDGTFHVEGFCVTRDDDSSLISIKFEIRYTR